MKKCKWCNEVFDTSQRPKGFMANHSRWCTKNPKRQQYINQLNEARNFINEETRIKMKLGISNAHKRGDYENLDRSNNFKGKKHKPETIKIIRQKALASKHRRLRKGMVDYNGIMLDSSWELALAIRLDELKVKWVRPDPIKWIDKNGAVHNYFPDFYLEDYDIYLDPKNPAAYKNQSEKIEILKKTYKNIKFILTLKQCKEFII